MSSYWVWLSAVLFWYQTNSHSSSLIKWKCVFATVLNYSHPAPFQPLNPLFCLLSLTASPSLHTPSFSFQSFPLSLCVCRMNCFCFLLCFVCVFILMLVYFVAFFVTPSVFSARGPCLIIALLSDYDLLSQRVVLSSWHCASPPHPEWPWQNNRQNSF